jgi:hypothetical protein
MRVWQAALVGITLALAIARPAWADIPPTPSRSQSDLALLFPSAVQLPPGMVLAEEGSRSAAEIAATFRDPVDTGQVLRAWGWAFNAYRVYVAGPGAGPESLTRLEVSLHQFSSNTGAAYALPYFAHDRAVMLDQQEGPTGLLRPCEAAVTGNREVTRYLRVGDLLVRVTSMAMPEAPREQAYFLTLGSATDVTLAVLANAGGSLRELDQTCR